MRVALIQAGGRYSHCLWRKPPGQVQNI